MDRLLLSEEVDFGHHTRGGKQYRTFKSRSCSSQGRAQPSACYAQYLHEVAALNYERSSHRVHIVYIHFTFMNTLAYSDKDGRRCSLDRVQSKIEREVPSDECTSKTDIYKRERCGVRVSAKFADNKKQEQQQQQQVNPA